MLIENFGNNTAGVVIDTPPLRDAIVPPVAEVTRGHHSGTDIEHHSSWALANSGRLGLWGTKTKQ